MAPDINESFGTFTVVTAGTRENRAVDSEEKVETIRFGLKAIKNVGEHIVDVLIKERKQSGPFKDIFDLLARVTDKDLNKKSLESLIKSGALESLGERGQLLSNMEKLLNFNKESIKIRDSKQNSLFTDLPLVDNFQVSLNPAPAASQEEKLIWEKELLGLYISEHPYNAYRPYLINFVVPIAELKKHKGDDRLIVAGVISVIKKIITRSGESMLFVKIEDASNVVELLIFPRLYKETTDLWREGKVIIVDGKISEKDQELKILVNRVLALNPLEPQKSVDNFKKILMEGGPMKNGYRNGHNNNYSNGHSNSYQAEIKTLALRIIFQKDLSAGELRELKEFFSLYPGKSEVYFKVLSDGKAKVIKTAFKVNNCEELKHKLEKKLGEAIKIIN
jgi:DNA polymerase-3 subunit alpha